MLNTILQYLQSLPLQAATANRPRRCWCLTLLLLLTLANGCTWWWEDDKQEVVEDTAQALLLQGRAQLAAANGEAALSTFEALSLLDGYACDGEYGQTLARLLLLFELLDPLVEVAGLLSGVGDVVEGTTVVRNYTPIIFEIVSPMELEFAALRVHLQRIIGDGCRFYLPEGFPVQLGRNGSEIYFSAVLGDEWDTAPARVLLAGIESAQAAIDLILSHRFTLLDDDLDQTVAALLESLPGQSLTAPGTSWVTLARSLGAVFDINPLFLDFSLNEADRGRMTRVDDDIEAAVSAIYLRDDADGESGLFIDLLAAARDDTTVTDNVFGLRDDGDGKFGIGDSLLFGIHSLTIGSLVAPNLDDVDLSTPPVSLYNLTIAGRIEIKLEPGLGDVDAALRNFQQMLEIMRRQMIAVDDPEAEWQRLGLAELNGILTAIDPLAPGLPPIPETIELDLRAYLQNPVAFRSLAPYWYDHDDDINTPDHWMIEAESAWPTTEAYVETVDAEHFPNMFVFDTLLQSNLNDATGSPPITSFRRPKSPSHCRTLAGATRLFAASFTLTKAACRWRQGAPPILCSRIWPTSIKPLTLC